MLSQGQTLNKRLILLILSLKQRFLTFKTKKMLKHYYLLFMKTFNSPDMLCSSPGNWQSSLINMPLLSCLCQSQELSSQVSQWRETAGDRDQYPPRFLSNYSRTGDDLMFLNKQALDEGTAGRYLSIMWMHAHLNKSGFHFYQHK